MLPKPAYEWRVSIELSGCSVREISPAVELPSVGFQVLLLACQQVVNVESATVRTTNRLESLLPVLPTVQILALFLLPADDGAAQERPSTSSPLKYSVRWASDPADTNKI